MFHCPCLYLITAFQYALWFSLSLQSAPFSLLVHFNSYIGAFSPIIITLEPRRDFKREGNLES